MNKLQIGPFLVGEGEPCFIIAEAGSNHNRDFQQALRLIDEAVTAGANAVKFQTFRARTLYSTKTPMIGYLKGQGLLREGESVWDLLSRIEIPWEWHEDLARYCGERGILFLSTPFDLEAVEVLEKVGVPAYKIASFEITHQPLLTQVARTGKPVILSTGMASLADIEWALEVIYRENNDQVVLLHCAVGYPPRYEDLHLRALHTLRQAFQVPVGYSDHTLGFTADVAAVALGAVVIEKHFTTDRRQPGPDHPFALEPPELRAMVEAIRHTEAAMGSPIKRHTEAEQELYRLARRSLVAACPIAKGQQISRDMLAVKRPGFGISARFIDVVVGRTARQDIEADEVLTWEMV